MWQVEFHDEFEVEFGEIEMAVQDAIFARVLSLKKYGPDLGRPYADTLSGLKLARMKELRCSVSKGKWRVAFAFDVDRSAILLFAGNKVGVKQNRFYKRLIAAADRRFEQHLMSRQGRK